MDQNVSEKDRKEARQIVEYIAREFCYPMHYPGVDRVIETIINLRTEAAEQARRKAADSAVEWRRAFGEYHQNDLLRAAILQGTTASELKMCEVCGGKGYTAEHSPGLNDHDSEGNCLGACPVQVQCEHCNGTGKVTASDPIADAVKAERERDFAGEVWDILVPYIKPLGKRSVTSIYDDMRKQFPIPAILQGTTASEPIIAAAKAERERLNEAYSIIGEIMSYDAWRQFPTHFRDRVELVISEAEERLNAILSDDKEGSDVL